MIDELHDFYGSREVQQRTPRKFAEVKGDNVLYNRNKPHNKCPKQVVNEEAHALREKTWLALDELAEEATHVSPTSQKIANMPLQLRRLLDVDPEAEKTVYRLMGLTQNEYLQALDVHKFMRKHKFSTEKQDKMIENVKFSKDFFEIIDDDGTGGILLEELAQPLIALGLATDSGFVKKALKVLNPMKYRRGFEGQELTMKEFSSIFKIDPISEKLTKMIHDQLIKVAETSDEKAMEIKVLKNKALR